VILRLNLEYVEVAVLVYVELASICVGRRGVPNQAGLSLRRQKDLPSDVHIGPSDVHTLSSC
jgi:hypothetical protein